MISTIALCFIIMSLLLMFISPLFKGTDWLVCLCIICSLVCMFCGIIVPCIS